MAAIERQLLVQKRNKSKKCTFAPAMSTSYFLVLYRDNILTYRITKLWNAYKYRFFLEEIVVLNTF